MQKIATMRPDGSGERRLTKGPLDEYPAWSPDGKRIAYVHYVGIGFPTLWVMNADGSRRRKLFTRQYAPLVDTHVDWLNNRRIVFGAQNTGLPNSLCANRSQPLACLYAVDTRDGRAKRLLTFPALKFSRQVVLVRAWAVHGSRVAYVLPDYTGLGAKRGGLFVMNLDDSGKTLVTRGPPAIGTVGTPPQVGSSSIVTESASIDWSPDGGRIVFVAGTDDPDWYPNTELYTVNVATGVLEKVPGRPWVEPHGGYITDPVWSPNGTKLIFNMELDSGFVLIPATGGTGKMIGAAPARCDTGTEVLVPCPAYYAKWQPTHP